MTRVGHGRIVRPQLDEGTTIGSLELAGATWMCARLGFRLLRVIPLWLIGA